MTNPHIDTTKLAYSIREAVAATSLGRTTIFRMLADPECPLRAIRVGGRTIIPAESLHALLAGEA
jgi:predicted DNA-binding transcriptional regulator AlpA